MCRHPSAATRRTECGWQRWRWAGARRSAQRTCSPDGRLSLLAVRIGTGRTHQIRVHLNHLRCPVLGDPLYGDNSVNKRESRRAARPLLHAYQLAVESPSPEGGRLVLHAPPPGRPGGRRISTRGLRAGRIERVALAAS